jgi:cytochrome c peroxidase
MPQPYSVDLRERAVAAYKRGDRTLEEVAAEFSVCDKTLALALQPTFMHNGAFTTLEAAIAHHLNVTKSARDYSPAHLAADLRGPVGPIEPVLARVDPLVATPRDLTAAEFEKLVEFVRNGLLDPRAKPERLRALIPASVPSGEPVHVFQ